MVFIAFVSILRKKIIGALYIKVLPIFETSIILFSGGLDPAASA